MGPPIRSIRHVLDRSDCRRVVRGAVALASGPSLGSLSGQGLRNDGIEATLLVALGVRAVSSVRAVRDVAHAPYLRALAYASGSGSPLVGPRMVCRAIDAGGRGRFVVGGQRPRLGCAAVVASGCQRSGGCAGLCVAGVLAQALGLAAAA